MVTLSILVPSVHSRRHDFALKIADELYGQWAALADPRRVEILMLTDAKGMVLGAKRNAMVQIAQGEYVAFVDDDDRVAPDYIASLLEAIDTHHPDVVTFLASVSLNGGAAKICRYSMRYGADRNTATEYHRIPNHLCAVRRELALRVPFESIGFGEDADYARRLRRYLSTEHQIGRVLYHYDYSAATTETKPGPLVDVVVLSRGDTPEKRAMTVSAVASCRLGDDRIAVTVIEQVEGVFYDGATTVWREGPFSYNAFANVGAARGSAPWIVIANNDLIFERGWFDQLLATGHPLVSPVSPRDRRQAKLTVNETGRQNGVHFSGWCFMIRRDLWKKIGGFDEDFDFWCADDAVIQQVVAVGVEPMIVPGAHVHHLGSQTLRVSEDTGGEMTWAQVDRFERKYGVQKFPGDRRYAKWKAANL